MKQIITLFFLISTLVVSAQTIATFENIDLPLDTFLNGSDGNGGFQSGNIFLPNNYNAEWNSWTGWAISTDTDTLTPGFLNQYSAIAGSGVEASDSYAVSFVSGESVIQLTEPQIVNGFYITNATYTYLSILEGDDFAKKFGGVTGDDPDFYLLTIKKYQDGNLSMDSINFYLADYRFEDNSQDYIIKDWTYVDVSSLGMADSLSLTVASSDIGQFGINTPTYLCVDNIATNLTTSIETVAMEEWLQVFPNPSAAFLQLKKNTLAPLQVAIFSMSGQELFSSALQQDQIIDIRSLEKGAYLLYVSQGDKQASEILIKQ